MTLKTCSKCSVARYCSKDCQTRDWREHRPLCRPLAEWKAGWDAQADALVEEVGGGAGAAAHARVTVRPL